MRAKGKRFWKMHKSKMLESILRVKEPRRYKRAKCSKADSGQKSPEDAREQKAWKQTKGKKSPKDTQEQNARKYTKGQEPDIV